MPDCPSGAQCTAGESLLRTAEVGEDGEGVAAVFFSVEGKLVHSGGKRSLS